MEMSKELLVKEKVAKTPAELMAFSKENYVDVT